MKRDVVITRVSDVDARYRTGAWHWADENRAAIDANWQRRIADETTDVQWARSSAGRYFGDAEVCRSIYFETRLMLISWAGSIWAIPDPGIANGFAMGALQGSDGAFICGVMARSHG